MNERIKQIIQTVGTDTAGRWVSIDNVELVAELIVGECITTIQKRFMGDLNREDLEVRRCVADLKRHFGVEDNMSAGARIHSDKGYELGTQEDYQEFARKRNEHTP